MLIGQIINTNFKYLAFFNKKGTVNMKIRQFNINLKIYFYLALFLKGKMIVPAE